MWQHSALLFALFGLSAAILDVTQICRDMREGDVVGNPFDCQSYFICSNAPSLRYCEAGLHFDAERKVCNWPEYAQCKLQLTAEQQAEVPPSGDKDSVSRNPHPIFMAVDVASGQVTNPLYNYDPTNVKCSHFGAYFLPHPKDCRKYYICAYGHLHQHKCGSDTLWNYKSEECELSKQAICYGESADHLPGHKKGEGDQHPPNAVYQGTVCYPVFINADGYTAVIDTGTTWVSLPTTDTTRNPTGTTWHPTDTTRNPTGTTWNPTGTTWHPTDTTRNPTGTTWNPTGTTWNPTDTTRNPTGSTWNPTDTTWHTTGSTTETPWTRTNILWTTTGTTSTTTRSPTDSTWIYTGPTQTSTVATLHTRNPTIAPASQSTSRAGPDCPTDRQAYLANPDDCGKYYICITGKPILTSCPEGLLWDSNAEFCDVPKNVNCYVAEQ